MMGRMALSLLLLALLAAQINAQFVCPPIPSRTYVDVIENKLDHKVSAFVYNITGNYEKNPIKNGMVYRINLSTGSQPNQIVYGVTDDGGFAKFEYDPQLEGCLDYWFIFCPVVDPSSVGQAVAQGSTEAINRERCLNGTGLPPAMIRGAIPRGDGKTNAPVSQPKYLLSHNEFYFCNHSPMDWAPFCWPLMLILGLLLGASFAVGRNPFLAFDMSAPRMNRGRAYTPRVQQRRFDALGYFYAAGSATETATGGKYNVTSDIMGKLGLNLISGGITKLFGFDPKKQKEKQDEEQTKQEKEKKRLEDEKKGLMKKYDPKWGPPPDEILEIGDKRGKINQVNNSISAYAASKKLNKKMIDEVVSTLSKTVTNSQKDIKKDEKKTSEVKAPPKQNVSMLSWNLFRAVVGLVGAIFGGGSEDPERKAYYGAMAKEMNDATKNMGWFGKLFVGWWVGLKFMARKNVEARGGWKMVFLDAFLTSLFAQSRTFNKSWKLATEIAYFTANPSALPSLLQPFGQGLSTAWDIYLMNINDNGFKPTDLRGAVENGRIAIDVEGGYKVIDKEGNATYWKKEGADWVKCDEKMVALDKEKGYVKLTDSGIKSALDSAATNPKYIAFITENGNTTVKALSKEEFESCKEEAGKYYDAIARTLSRQLGAPPDKIKGAIELYNSIVEGEIKEKADFNDAGTISTKNYNEFVKFAKENELVGLIGLIGGGKDASKIYSGIDALLTGLSNGGLLGKIDKLELEYTELKADEKAKYITSMLREGVMLNGENIDFKGLLKLSGNMLDNAKEVNEYQAKYTMYMNAQACANAFSSGSASDATNAQMAYQSYNDYLNAKELSGSFNKAIVEYAGMTPDERKAEMDRIKSDLKQFEYFDDTFKKKIEDDFKDGKPAPKNDYESYTAEQKEYYELFAKKMLFEKLGSGENLSIDANGLGIAKNFTVDAMKIYSSSYTVNSSLGSFFQGLPQITAPENVKVDGNTCTLKESGAEVKYILNEGTWYKANEDGTASETRAPYKTGIDLNRAYFSSSISDMKNNINTSIGNGLNPDVAAKGLNFIYEFCQIDADAIKNNTKDPTVRNAVNGFVEARNVLLSAFFEYQQTPNEPGASAKMLSYIATFASTYSSASECWQSDKSHTGFQSSTEYFKTGVGNPFETKIKLNGDLVVETSFAKGATLEKDVVEIKTYKAGTALDADLTVGTTTYKKGETLKSDITVEGQTYAKGTVLESDLKGRATYKEGEDVPITAILDNPLIKNYGEGKTSYNDASLNILFGNIYNYNKQHFEADYDGLDLGKKAMLTAKNNMQVYFWNFEKIWSPGMTTSTEKILNLETSGLLSDPFDITKTPVVEMRHGLDTYSNEYRRQVKANMEAQLYGPGLNVDYGLAVDRQIERDRENRMTSQYLQKDEAQRNLQEYKEEVQEIIEKNSYLSKIAKDKFELSDLNSQYETVRKGVPEQVFHDWKKDFLKMPDERKDVDIYYGKKQLTYENTDGDANSYMPDKKDYLKSSSETVGRDFGIFAYGYAKDKSEKTLYENWENAKKPVSKSTSTTNTETEEKKTE